jgi:hypothetical protein
VAGSTRTSGVLTRTSGRSRPRTAGGVTRTSADGTRTRATGVVSTAGGVTGGRMMVPDPPWSPPPVPAAAGRAELAAARPEDPARSGGQRMQPQRVPASRGQPPGGVDLSGGRPSGRRRLDRRGRELGDPDRRGQALEGPRQPPPAAARLRRPLDQAHDRGQGDQDEQQPAVADPGGSGQPNAHTSRLGRLPGFLDATPCPIARSCRHSH